MNGKALPEHTESSSKEGMVPETQSAPLSSKKMVVALFIAAALLTGLSIGMELQALASGQPIPEWFLKILHIGHEHNVPSLLSAAIAAWASILLWNIARNHHADECAGSWKLLAVIFSLLAIDEAFAFHEKLPLLLNPVYTWLDNHVWRHSSDIAYIIPYAAGLFIALVFFKFVCSLPKQTRRLIIAAGILFITGALLMETTGFLFTHAASIFAPAEEGMEMMGLILFVYALMKYRTASGRLEKE